ncbi:MAG: SDR family NAD(P)-dependent oxidoreductase [Bacteroidota bacterium]
MRTALITGATAGFGRAIAESLAKANYRIIITGRRTERLLELREELQKMTEVHTLSFDVRDEDAVKAAFESLPEDWRIIDVLVNNAGLALGKASIEDGLSEDWDQMMDTNVKGLMYVTQAAIPFLKSTANAHIVNIGSIAGTEVYPGGNAYCASKHAVNAISQALRIELLPYQIRVSQIRPGLAETEFSLVRFKGDREKADAVYKDYVALTAEDIARTVQFVLDSPKHVCINDLEITPTAQANAHFLHKNR